MNVRELSLPSAIEPSLLRWWLLSILHPSYSLSATAGSIWWHPSLDQEGVETLERRLVDQMIASTTNDDWKVVLAMARYGGLRLPSELVQLQWKHVNFDQDAGSMLVHSPKTEHHEAKETRYVPLFDELREILSAARPDSVDGDDFVIRNPNYRRPKANLRTQFVKIAKKAGVKPWGKAFQNMRATRETELIRLCGITEACEIIGNSPNVALQHYDMVSPEYMSSAIQRAREAKKRG